MTYCCRQSFHIPWYSAWLKTASCLLLILSRSFELFPSFQGSFLQCRFCRLLERRKLFLLFDFRWGCCHLNWCCLYVICGFETDLFYNLNSSREKRSDSCCVGWIHNVCFSEKNLQHIATCVPQWRWVSFRPKETSDWFIISQDNCRLRCFTKKCVHNRKKLYKLPNNLAIKFAFWVEQGRTFLIRTPQANNFSSLSGFFALDSLISREPNQHFSSLHLLWRQVGSLQETVLVPGRKRRWGFFDSSGALTFCWCLLKACRMYWSFQPSSGYKFCSNWRVPGGGAEPFSSGITQRVEKSLFFVGLLWNSFSWDGPNKTIKHFSTQVVFFYW